MGIPPDDRAPAARASRRGDSRATIIAAVAGRYLTPGATVHQCSKRGRVRYRLRADPSNRTEVIDRCWNFTRKHCEGWQCGTSSNCSPTTAACSLMNQFIISIIGTSREAMCFYILDACITASLFSVHTMLDGLWVRLFNSLWMFS